MFFDQYGNLMVNVAAQVGGGSVVNVADPTTPTQKLAIDNLGNARTALYGKNAAPGDTPVLVDSSGRLLTANYIGGSPVSNTNPYPSIDQVRALIANGQGFNISTKQVSPAATGQTLALALFNPAGSAKNVYIYSIKISTNGGANQHQLNTITADPALGSTPTVTNMALGNATAMTATAEYTNTNQSSLVGTLFEAIGMATNVVYEYLQSGAGILLPKAAASIQGVIAYLVVATASSNWYITIKTIEY